jgi:hypothetical protein
MLHSHWPVPSSAHAGLRWCKVRPSKIGTRHAQGFDNCGLTAAAALVLVVVVINMIAINMTERTFSINSLAAQCADTVWSRSVTSPKI